MARKKYRVTVECDKIAVKQYYKGEKVLRYYPNTSTPCEWIIKDNLTEFEAFDIMADILFDTPGVEYYDKDSIKEVSGDTSFYVGSGFYLNREHIFECYEDYNVKLGRLWYFVSECEESEEPRPRRKVKSAKQEAEEDQEGCFALVVLCILVLGMLVILMRCCMGCA